MELAVSGNAIKTFNRAITCLARIGNELIVDCLPAQIVFRTLNSSRSAFLAITFKAHFFDTYRLSVAQAQCSVLLKAVCTVFRTPATSMECLSMHLSDMEATKVQWTLDCVNGIRKTYWISCNYQPDIQHLALDRASFPSHLVVKPRDLNSDGALHTQLWIDPTEELQEYSHRGAAVDVTFSVKELKVGEPILLAPKFSLDDAANADFDATLVLATMLISHLREVNNSEQIPVGSKVNQKDDHGAGSQGFHTPYNAAQRRHELAVPSSGSEDPSDHTRIWSELSGSGTKSVSKEAASHHPMQDSADASEEIPVGVQRQEKLYEQNRGQAERDNTPQPWRPTGRISSATERSSIAGRHDAQLHSGGVTNINPGNYQTAAAKNLCNWISADSEEEDGDDESNEEEDTTTSKEIELQRRKSFKFTMRKSVKPIKEVESSGKKKYKDLVEGLNKS